MPITIRDDIKNLGLKSLSWIKEECEICDPAAIITLGDEVARIITKSKESADSLLSAVPARPAILAGRFTFLSPHPDACRRAAE